MATNTLYSKVNYTGDGTTKSFVVPFPYLYVNDVHLFVDDEEVNVYPVISHDDPPSGYEAHWYSSNTLRFITAPDSDAEIIIQRITNRAAPEVEFENSSILTEEDLNLIATQLLYIVQEAYDNFSLDYDEIIEKLDAAMEASQIATSAKNDILTLSGGLTTAINNGINAITSAGGTQVTNITSAGDVQAARVENIATSYLTYAGLSWLEATWTLEEAADEDDVIDLPEGISYIVGHHHMMLSYDGMVFDRTRWEEIGENETQSSSFTTKIALAAGTELTVRVAPLSSNEEIAISAASVASAAAESASASAESATAAQLEIEELTSQINTTTNNVDEVASATTALDTRVTSLETSLNAIGAHLPSVLPAADIMAGKDADGNVITSTYVNVTSAQTVGGAKTFTDSAVFSSGATFSGGISVSSGAIINSATVTSGATISGGATVTSGVSADMLTVTSGATISGGIVMQAGDGNELTTTADNVTLTIAGGTDATDAPFLALVGKTKDANGGRFVIHADNGADESNLAGFPDGTLTWGNKGFVYTSTDQTIGGTKTFSAERILMSNNNGALTKMVDVAATSYPSSTRRLYVTVNSLTSDRSIAYVSPWWSSENVGSTMYIYIPSSSTGYAVALRTYNGSTPYFMPDTSGVYLGRNASGNKWKQVIAESSTISTSDEREKSNISLVPDDVLDAWGDVQWSQYQMIEAIAEKGEDKARLHNGLVAQRIASVFEAHGLDASRYGLWCYDAWPATPEERDDEGNIITPASEANDAYALRYEEALAMEAAYQRRRADRAEARLADIERRLAALEAAE